MGNFNRAVSEDKFGGNRNVLTSGKGVRRGGKAVSNFNAGVNALGAENARLRNQLASLTKKV